MIMPVYNEEKTIEQVISNVAKQALVGQIIVVDDGSTDRTKDILSGLLPAKVEVVRNQTNRGKGSAVRKALSKLAYKIVVIQDADLEYDPADYKRLLVPIISQGADVVVGNRLNLRNFFNHPFHLLGNKFITFLVNVLNLGTVKDIACGLKMFRLRAIENIEFKSNGFEFCVEFTTKILKAGYKIYSVPVAYSPRSYSQGKKISWRDRWKHIEAALLYALKSKTPKG